MARRFILMLTIAVTTTLLTSTPANATSYGSGIVNCSLGGTFTIVSDKVMTSDSCQGAAVVPSGVSEIYQSAFEDQSLLTSVVIPSTVWIIDKYAFYNTANLQAVTFEAVSELDTIEMAAFSGATSLASITLPANLNSLGDFAFSGATSLATVNFGSPSRLYSISRAAFQMTALENIVIPDSVERIDEYAFSSSESLESISFGVSSELEEIGSYAFVNNTSLTTITIPRLVSTIGERAFTGTSSLSNIDVSEPNRNFSSDSGVLYNQDKTNLIKFPDAKSTPSFSVPNSVTTIGNYALSDTRGLLGVTIPSSVTSIGDFAFNGSGITSIGIPSDVTYLGEGVFRGATSLIQIYVDPNNDVYGSSNGALIHKADATLLAYPLAKRGSYDIPSGLTYIAWYAFYGATSLTNVTIPSSISYIGLGAFEGATSLTNVTIPSSVYGIGDNAFYGATSLKDITFKGNAPEIFSDEGNYLRNSDVFTNIGSNPIAHVSFSASGFDLGSNNKWHNLTVVRDFEDEQVAAQRMAEEARIAAEQAEATRIAAAQAATAELASRTVSAKKKYAAKSLAQQTGVAMVSPKAKVTFKVAKSSKKICTKSGSKLKTLKAGNCVVTFTVQEPKPKKGKKPKATKTVKTFIVQ